MRVESDFLIRHRVNFIRIPKYQIRRLCRFQSQDPHPHARRSKKNYLHPSLVFATIKIMNSPKTSLANPKGSKAESPSVVRWSAVTRRPEHQENNKQRHRSAKCSSTNMRRIPFTREQWQPRYLPSFLSKQVTSPRHQARARRVARACHRKDFF